MARIPRPSVSEHVRLSMMGRDIGSLLETLHARWGPVVDVGYRVPMRMHYLFGPDANRLILQEQADNFRWADAMSTLLVVNGPTALVLTDGDEHRRRRRLVQPAFSRRRIDAHLDLIVDEMDRLLDTWTEGRSLDAFASLRPAVRRIVVRALFGESRTLDPDRIGQLLEPALRHVNKNPVNRLDVDLRWNGFGRAARARKAVDELLMREIARRRADGAAGPDDGHDTLSALLAAGAVEGEEPLGDAELCDQVRSLIAAGYDTTTSAAAWLVHGLGANPGARERLREQVVDQLGERRPTVEDLRSMPLVDGVVRETLRLWPPGAVGARHAVGSFDFAGYTIPAGAMVLYSPYITHRLPELWGDPGVYRPERWLDGEPAPYSFVPFGGGARPCIGFALATLELQVLAVRLAQRRTWVVDGPEPAGRGIANFAPDGGIPIRVT